MKNLWKLIFAAVLSLNVVTAFANEGEDNQDANVETTAGCDQCDKSGEASQESCDNAQSVSPSLRPSFSLEKRAFLFQSLQETSDKVRGQFS